jgi:hypothetical protein
MSEPAIRNARARQASSAEIAGGLLAFASFDYGELRLGATVRRTVNGRPYLSFPARVVHGERVPHVEPLDQAARDRIERAVLEQLGFASRRRA